MIRMRQLLAKFIARTIWAPDAIPLSEFKYRNLKRVVLPLIDVVWMIGGILGSNHGIPTLDKIYGPEVSGIGGVAFAVIAFVCLLGISFPSLWRLEIFGKSTLLGMVTGYIGALVFTAFVTQTSAAYVISLAAVSIIIIIWRLTLLAQEARDRNSAK